MAIQSFEDLFAGGFYGTDEDARRTLDEVIAGGDVFSLGRYSDREWSPCYDATPAEEFGKWVSDHVPWGDRGASAAAGHGVCRVHTKLKPHLCDAEEWEWNIRFRFLPKKRG